MNAIARLIGEDHEAAEAREVQIGQEIIALASSPDGANCDRIKELAQELIAMHGPGGIESDDHL